MRDHTAADALRVVLYSHDSVGLGHIRRNLAIAEALAAGLPAHTGRPVSGLLVSGASDAAQFPLPDGWDWLLVPGIAKAAKKEEHATEAQGSHSDAQGSHHPVAEAPVPEPTPADSEAGGSLASAAAPTPASAPDSASVPDSASAPDSDSASALASAPEGAADCTYVARRLDVAPQRVLGVRSSVITGALLSFRPHLVIVDRHPFGADGELDEPLAAYRRAEPDGRIVLGLREVLDDPHTASAEWDAVGADRVAELYDELWVYGDRAVHDTVATGEIPAPLVPKTRFTGLLASDRQVRATADLPDDPFVVTMVGGGGDGVVLARAAATAPLPDGVQHLVVTGPQMPAPDRMAVHAAAVVSGSGARVVSRIPDGLDCIRAARAVIAMGGYNTVSEALSTDTPALVFPRVEPRTEQLIRARALGLCGALDWLLPCRLTPQTVGRWIAAAVADDSAVRARQTAARDGLDLDGLSRVVEFAAGLATPDTARVHPLRPRGLERAPEPTASRPTAASSASTASGSSNHAKSNEQAAPAGHASPTEQDGFGLEAAHVS
ncbi:glycosyltransferase family protein [Brevibacterium yomogidense]|uniref:glycosyltransferase family protein n=1 Tax=Brevibacterium yomogidense TaxID=946573 RepID=UPI0018E02E29|nr:glycosyl transferase family 28 [Brevibacterium yomogidense]